LPICQGALAGSLKSFPGDEVPAPRFYNGNPFTAKGAFLRKERRGVYLEKGGVGKIGGIDGLVDIAVDERSGPYHMASGGPGSGCGLPDGAARCHDIFNGKDFFSGFDCKPAAKEHFTIDPFTENSPGPEGGGDFLTDHNPTHRGGDHQIDPLLSGEAQDFPDLPAKIGAEIPGDRGVLQNQGALEIDRTVPPRGQPEMPLKEGAVFPEKGEIITCHPAFPPVP